MEFSIPMALVDFIPVVLSMISGLIIQKQYHERMSLVDYALLCAGIIMSIVASICKALWKLLYAANIVNFISLNQMFFPMMAIGYSLAGLAMILHYFFNKKDKAVKALAVAPPVYTGTFFFVSIMILGLGEFCLGLGLEAIRLGKKKLSLVYVLAYVLLLLMGFMSTRDSSSAIVNWMAEVINLASESLLLWANIQLVKAMTAENRG